MTATTPSAATSRWYKEVSRLVDVELDWLVLPKTTPERVPAWPGRTFGKEWFSARPDWPGVGCRRAGRVCRVDIGMEAMGIIAGARRRVGRPKDAQNMFMALSRQVWWRTMWADVEEWVSKCIT